MLYPDFLNLDCIYQKINAKPYFADIELNFIRVFI